MRCKRCEEKLQKNEIRCHMCGAWNMGGGAGSTRIRLRDVPISNYTRVEIGYGNYALNGGCVLSHVIMLGGEPGTGKSTLALEWAQKFKSCLYISAEEPSEQVRDRSLRLGEDLLDKVDFVDAMGGDVNIDSALQGDTLQLIILDSLPGLVGIGPASDADALLALKTLKKHVSDTRTCALVIEHATKSDEFAGRLSLQHEVDATIFLRRGEKLEDRILYTYKNRSGPSRTEHGVLSEKGFVTLRNQPS